MNKTFQMLTLGFCLVGGFSPAMAQTATPETTPAPAQVQPAPDAAAPADLSMGEAPKPGLPTQAEAAVGATYLAASFDKWEQRCAKTEDGGDPCQLYQLLEDKDGNDVAEISVFNLPDGGPAAAGATVMAPLETLLTANLKIAIDGRDAKIYPFAFCTTSGCAARIGFTAEEVVQLKKGNTARLTIVPAVAPDKTVDLEMTLKGFTAGLAAVTTTNVPN